MGLSGRKTKQRIGADPRNLTWANDASKFGSAYLEKFGWASGSGLGVSGEGRTKHISVYQKLDMLGIGADHKNNQDGTAWKQGRDFENLLQRLNAGAGQEEGAADVPKIGGFVRPSALSEESGQEVEVPEEKEQEEPRKSKKRKHGEKGDDDGDEGSQGRRKKKKDKKDKKTKAKERESTGEESKKEKKQRQREASKDETSASGESNGSVNAVSEATTPANARVVAPRPMRAHRARHIAMKGLASKSSTAIAEILGVSSSSAATPSLTDSPEPSASSTALDTPASAPAASSASLKMQDLTTSSKSVMDYFREKLAAKSNRASESSTPAVAETPASDDYDDRPRGGLGLGASRLRVEVAGVEDYDDRPRGGLGSSMLAASLATMSFVRSTSEVVPARTIDSERPLVSDAGGSAAKRQSKKRKHKEDEDGDPNGARPGSEAVLLSSAVENKKKKKNSSASDDADIQGQEGRKVKRRKKAADGVEDVAVSEEKSKRRRKKNEAEDAS
ncbi:hypothetical protein DAEQUDRAFT_723262 [Daedalea quercina L-15889]|uniref:PinX1-related protein 1 n=1 Tax=Daedalea quercina L-15889 TaxID=1314783 RepID=A0A165SJN4_9APHY|nr:hypothetical protein DAEQUDRAFT_723262 [Daedalea quercina L-15889]